ncbi:MAG TPA: hypothetical protein VFW65_24170 [Pseudonocardiaceae bacterium]|nr:hypothetical protein [Pseudonocardiaceae bacterium]
MPKDEQEPPIDTGRPAGTERKPWFRPNRSGVGWRPYAWQGWLILAVVVAAIVVVVVMLRTGVL